MITPDYYSILNLNKDCTINEIKSSYKRLALIYHPDRNLINGENKENMDNSKKFKEISEAYQILSDENKRQKYDLTNNIDSLDFKSPIEIFNFFFKDVPKEYLDISNNFIQKLIQSPEKKISQKIMQSLPEQSEIHQIVKVVSFLFKEPGWQNNNEKKKNNQKTTNYHRSDHDENPNTNNNENNYQKQNVNGTNDNVKVNENIYDCKSTIDNNSNEKINEFNNNFTFKYLKTENIITTIHVSLEDIYKGEVKKIDIVRFRKQDNNSYKKEKKTFILPLNREQIIFYNEADELPDYQEAGDIIINIEHFKHKIFKKYKKNNLWTDINVSLYEFYLGTSFTLNFFDEKNITIYSGKNIYNKPIKKIKGLGLPNEKGLYGDLYINFKLQLNKLDLDDKQVLKYLFTNFPPINKVTNNDYDNHQQYLLETETYDSLDNEINESLDR